MAATFAIILVVSALFAVAYPFIHDYKLKKRRIRLDKDVQYFQQRIAVVTSDSIPGQVTEQVLGPVTGTSQIPASNDEERKLADREAMFSLINQALQMGANAVVGLKMATESYQFTEPKKFVILPAVQWMATKVMYTGTAVKVASADSPGQVDG